MRDGRIREIEEDLKAVETRKDQLLSAIRESVKSMTEKYKNLKQRILQYRTDIGNVSAYASAGGSMMLEHAITNIDKALELQRDRERKATQDLTADFLAESQNAEERKAKAAREYEETNAKYRREFQEAVKALETEYAGRIKMGMNEADIHAYNMEATSVRINGNHYVSSKALPDVVYFGKLCTEFDSASDADRADIAHIISKEAHEITTRQEKSIKLSMPYVQRYREDGLSLMVKYASSENDKIKKMILPMLLKMFMAFPAGKLEATMIDPLGSGSSFPDIVKLAGATAERVIDSKIWCEAAEIDNAISAFRRKIDTQTQAYGEDITSRLNREEIKVLAITDFPHGFGQNALANLQSIVRNSAKNGVIILIWTDERELENLRQRNESIVKEIEQRVIVCREQDQRYYLDSNLYGDVFLELDPMTDILENKDEIIATLANDISNYRQKIEKFADLFKFDIEDSNNWFRGENDKISIPIGIKGADTVVNMILGKSDGTTEHHMLLAGPTGAGKTSLMHTLITSAMITYSPYDLQLYLVDFKEGIEFKQYTRYRLPNLKVIAVDSEREFGLNILKELCEELENRADIFSRNNVADIISYNQISNRRMPRILLIFDEVQELFRSGSNDYITSESLSCIGKLVTQGRALGIHLVLSCQDFSNCSGLQNWFSHFVVRMVIRGDSAGAASILDPNNQGIQTLQNRPAGSAIYNRMCGDPKWNIFFQVSYLTSEERQKYIELLDAYYRQPAMVEYYKDFEQRVLLTNAEDDIHSCFNRLIEDGKESLKLLATKKNRYGLILGQGFGKKSVLIKEFSEYEGDNLLIVGRDEKKAMAICEYAILSVLYDELNSSHDATNTLCYVADYSDLELRDDTAGLNDLAEAFEQVETVDARGIGELIGYLYKLTSERIQEKNAGASGFEQIFFILFGINRVRALRDYASNVQNGELSLINKLENVLLYGPTVGVNSIIWSEKNNLNDLFVGNIIERIFEQRIAYGLSDNEMEMLVEESEAGLLQDSSAVYFDINERRNVHFRPYNLPAKTWVLDIADAYAEITEEE